VRQLNPSVPHESIAQAVAVAFVASIGVVCLTGASSTQDVARVPPHVEAGLFTAAQADRGLLAYERSCTKCHQSDLQGSQETEAPALSGDTFASHWAGQPIKDLLDKISTKMPADNPGSLSAQASLDIVAYLLQANNAPAGGTELNRTAQSLARTIPDSKAARTRN
jgi:cytochrome c